MAGNNSIQFVRGNNISGSDEELLPGQPAYDLTTKYLYVGDGSKISETSPIKASFADDAENVTSTINGKNISDIFEENGTTAKEATNSPKSLYNLGAFDTYVDNGNDTVTVTRKTECMRLDGSEAWVRWGSDGSYFYTKTPQAAYLDNNLGVCVGSNPSLNYENSWNGSNTLFVYSYGNSGWGSIFAIGIDGVTSPETCKEYFRQNPTYVQYQLADSESYTEDVISKRSINTLDANMSNIVRDEVEKTLNLANPWSTGRFVGVYYTISENGAFLGITNEDNRQWNYSNADIYMVLQPGTYTASVTFSGTLVTNRKCAIFTEDGTELCGLSPTTRYEQSFTLSQETSIGIMVKSFDGGIAEFMLNEGSHAYPYQPYNGAIVHEKQLNDALENYLPLTGGTVNGELGAQGLFTAKNKILVETGGGSYNEGVRINRSTDDGSSHYTCGVFMGGNKGTTEGQVPCFVGADDADGETYNQLIDMTSEQRNGLLVRRSDGAVFEKYNGSIQRVYSPNNKQGELPSKGRVAPYDRGSNPMPDGLSMSEAYNDNYPTAYGNLLNLGGAGKGQILVGWSGNEGEQSTPSGLWYRSARDKGTQAFSEWKQAVTSVDGKTGDVQLSEIGVVKRDLLWSGNHNISSNGLRDISLSSTAYTHFIVDLYSNDMVGDMFCMVLRASYSLSNAMSASIVHFPQSSSPTGEIIPAVYIYILNAFISRNKLNLSQLLSS